MVFSPFIFLFPFHFTILFSVYQFGEGGKLNALLDMNQGDVPVVGGEPDEKDSQQTRDRNNREER